MSEQLARISNITELREVARESRGEQQQEMLVVMTGMTFVEQHALLSHGQLDDAKRSIQALFLRTTGEETMLRKLVEILRLNRDLHHAFSSISKVSVRIGTSAEVISKKINYLRQYVSQLKLTPQESEHFFSPFLSFTHEFREKILSFNDRMRRYLELKEQEARRLHEFRIAHDASERLRERLSGHLGTEAQGEVETHIRNEVLSTFDFAESQENLRDAQRASRLAADEIAELLGDLKDMCEMATNPDLREDLDSSGVHAPDFPDIFDLFSRALKRHPRLVNIKDFILDYFKLYQRAYGMFALDFNNFNKAVDTIANNPDGYFDAKQEDEDIRVKTTKLKKIEGLIPFLDRSSMTLVEEVHETYQQFSRRISEVISDDPSRWAHIREDLLMAKVSAEADLRTQI
ncbi:MAG: hypothetical protein LJE84_09460 [Gammaproteobacteria bacterium]|nr:hypothetical protein [Gammaproteobacteria bacterium]